MRVVDVGDAAMARTPVSVRDSGLALLAMALAGALALQVGCARKPAGTSQVNSENPAVAVDAYAPPRIAGKLNESLGEISGPVHYFAKQADLNGDGRPELIVHVAGPMVCGTGGCNTIVFTQDGEDLREVASISVTRPPIVVAETSSNGWRDLVVQVSGGGMLPGHSALLRFDGSSYPANPTVEPAEPLEQDVTGETAIPDFESFTEGELLRAGAD